MEKPFCTDYIGFVGTTSLGGGLGVYKIGLDVSLTEMKVLDIQPMYNSGYLTLSQDRKSLYVLSEGMTFHGQASGGITAYDLSDGQFKEQNWSITKGQRPCFVSCDDKEKEIYVSNFYHGSLAVYQRQENGSLGEMVDYIEHPKTNHEPSLLHCAVKSPTGRYLASLELVGGCIFLYDCWNHYEIIWKEILPEHSGPRHLIFSQDGRFLYINRQEDEFVSVYAFFPEEKKKLVHCQTISVRTPDMRGKTEPAAIRLCPGKNLLAVSNRGMGSSNREDSIALYEIDKCSGQLSLKQTVRTTGEMPRDFNFTPDGKYLVVGYQFQGYLDIYRVDMDSLTYIGNVGNIPSPVCIVF